MNSKRQALRGLVILVGTMGCPLMALGGGHTWKLNEIYTNSSGTVQFIELRESLGGNGETAISNHTISTVTAPAHSYLIPGPNVTPPTGFKTFLLATPAAAATPGFPTPDRILNAQPFFSLVADTINASGWPPAMTYTAGQLPTDGVRSRNVIGSVIACMTPTNYAGQTATLNLACTLPGDVDGNGDVNARDIAGFIRHILNTSVPADNRACAEFCHPTLAANVTAFVNSVLN